MLTSASSFFSQVRPLYHQSQLDAEGSSAQNGDLEHLNSKV